MKAVQVLEAGGDFEVVEKSKPKPTADEVLIKIEACGICHSDAFVKEGLFPGIEYPRIPGHEVIGVIEKVGSDIVNWQEGQRVGVGWHGGHCHTCDACRRGEYIHCENAQIAGISYDGGYAEYMTAPKEALASVPGDLKSEEAAPLLCAGITTFNALRNAGLKAGARVAVQGIGGLGHLGVQYAHHMGYETVAISGTPDKEKLAKELGAHHFINYKEQDPAEALQALGGADLIVATAPNSKAISSVVKGLNVKGKLLVVGVAGEPIQVEAMDLIAGERTIAGWPSGTPVDSEDTLNFSALFDTKPMIETFPLEQAAEAYEHMITNKARFRTVLTMD
ncbi:MAG: alcohol dehydrogenase [Balneolaceae bacterium]|nr:alcohol dehydrogenase [Balneolaceae bacterium]